MFDDDEPTRVPAATAAEALERMRTLAAAPANYERDVRHIEADALLCDVLRMHGFGELVDAFDRVGKWYS